MDWDRRLDYWEDYWEQDEWSEKPVRHVLTVREAVRHQHQVAARMNFSYESPELALAAFMANNLAFWEWER
jgi:hypothetical protein